MSKELWIHSDGHIPLYPIRMEPDLSGLAALLAAEEAQARRVCLVFDSNVAACHQAALERAATPAAKEVFSFVFPAGEANKNLDTVRTLYEFLIQNRFDRKDLLVAVGGGVTGDLTGFTASTYLRGIRFLQVPTTLLAMADSSIGGKTGVDLGSYKNMVGAFYQPKAVYMDFSLLATLPEREYLSGMGEIIKHAYIRDAALLPLLRENAGRIRVQDPASLEEIVYRSCLVKQAVVERDPKEQGERALLNFGHTIGHAIERLAGFHLLHGECVALGMVAAAGISVRRGMLPEAGFEGMKELLAAYRLPVTVGGLDEDAILATARLDKKMDAGQIRFILLEGIGNAVIDCSLTEKEMRSGIREVLR